MSLDLALYGPAESQSCRCASCDHEHTRIVSPMLWSWSGLTHNLGRIAGPAGIYLAVWRPEEIGAVVAADIVDTLRAGLAALRADPDRFRALNPPNGWGRYEGLVECVAEYLAACEANPTARIEACR